MATTINRSWMSAAMQVRRCPTRQCSCCGVMWWNILRMWSDLVCAPASATEHALIFCIACVRIEPTIISFQYRHKLLLFEAVVTPVRPITFGGTVHAACLSACADATSVCEFVELPNDWSEETHANVAPISDWQSLTSAIGLDLKSSTQYLYEPIFFVILRVVKIPSSM